MHRRVLAARVVFAQMAVAMFGAGICGCALVDQFGGRASDYNFQAASAKNTTILLNIVRAAYSQPLEFTDITTVAGTASDGATVSASFPFPQNKAAQLAAQAIGLTPSVTASSSSTVNVANLDTQEFYYGLQAPLSMQQIAYYIVGKFGGLDSYELLPLLISDIQLHSTDGKTVILHNRGDNKAAFNAFYRAIGFLVDNGLTVEQVKKAKPTTVGPILSATEAKDPRLLAAIVTAASASGANSSSGTSASGTTGSTGNTGTTGSASGSPGSSGGLTLVERTEKVDGKPVVIGYQFEKGGVGGSGNYRFCFAIPHQPYKDIDFTILTAPTDPLTIPLAQPFGRPGPNLSLKIGKQYYCGQGTTSPPTANNQDQKAGESITITTRSLEGIFYYLGEMVRTELGIANGDMLSLAIPSTQEEADTGQGFRLFRVERRSPIAGEPWVFYNGTIYSITIDPSGQHDASSRILQLVADLMALQSSAKALPAPNLIAITTQ